MHRTFDVIITNLHQDQKDADEKHHKVNMIFHEIIISEIHQNSCSNEKIQTFPLISVGNIHIGVVSFFYIPKNPNGNREQNNQKNRKKIGNRFLTSEIF